MRVDELQQEGGGAGRERGGGGSHVAARLETSQFKRLRSRPLAATERDCKTLRMRNIYAFIFVSARNQIYIFGPLKLIIILPHTKTAFTDKGGQQVGVRERERERYEYEMRCSFWLWLWLCGSAAALSPLNVLVISFGQHPSAHTHTHTHIAKLISWVTGYNHPRERGPSKPANRKQRTEKTWPKIDYGNG